MFGLKKLLYGITNGAEVPNLEDLVAEFDNKPITNEEVWPVASRVIKKILPEGSIMEKILRLRKHGLEKEQLQEYLQMNDFIAYVKLENADLLGQKKKKKQRGYASKQRYAYMKDVADMLKQDSDLFKDSVHVFSYQFLTTLLSTVVNDVYRQDTALEILTNTARDRFKVPIEKIVQEMCEAMPEDVSSHSALGFGLVNSVKIANIGKLLYELYKDQSIILQNKIQISENDFNLLISNVFLFPFAQAFLQKLPDSYFLDENVLVFDSFYKVLKGLHTTEVTKKRGKGRFQDVNTENAEYFDAHEIYLQKLLPLAKEAFENAFEEEKTFREINNFLNPVLQKIPNSRLRGMKAFAKKVNTFMEKEKLGTGVPIGSTLPLIYDKHPKLGRLMLLADGSNKNGSGAVYFEGKKNRKNVKDVLEVRKKTFVGSLRVNTQNSSENYVGLVAPKNGLAFSIFQSKNKKEFMLSANIYYDESLYERLSPEAIMLIEYGTTCLRFLETYSAVEYVLAEEGQEMREEWQNVKDLVQQAEDGYENLLESFVLQGKKEVKLPKSLEDDDEKQIRKKLVPPKFPKPHKGMRPHLRVMHWKPNRRGGMSSKKFDDHKRFMDKLKEIYAEKGVKLEDKDLPYVGVYIVRVENLKDVLECKAIPIVSTKTREPLAHKHDSYANYTQNVVDMIDQNQDLTKVDTEGWGTLVYEETFVNTIPEDKIEAYKVIYKKAILGIAGLK